MNKNIKKISFLTIAIIMFLTIFNFSTVMAASTTLTATTSKTVESGGTFKVTVKSSLKLTGWTIAVANNGGCIFSTATGGELTGTTIYGTALNGTTSLATYTFKAPTVTKDTKYTISFSGTEMCDIDTNEVSAANKPSVTITVKAKAEDKKEETTDKNTTTNKDTNTEKDTTTKPKEKSNNAYLSTLGVRIKDKLAEELGVKADEYDFTGFSKIKTSYSVTIPKNVDYLNVVYGKSDSNATVKVTGNSGFEVGSNNKITIKVTAEDGKTTKTYTIKVTKLAEEEEKPGNLIEDMEGIYLTSLSVEGIELSPEFSKDVYSYTAELNDSSINELKVTAEANNEKVNIDISGNTELVEGDNTINIVLTLEDSTDQIVYQVVVTKAVATEVITETPEKTESSTTDLIGMIKGYVGIAIGVVLLMIVAVIVLIVLLRKENKRIREEDEEDIEEVTEEYNVYNNDENKFEDNDIKKDNFIESLYKQRNGNTYNEEELSEEEKETIEEINEQTEKIFAEKVEGQSVEYTSNDSYEENPLETRRKRRRGKGKHSL